jgi:hypothetical protein
MAKTDPRFAPLDMSISPELYDEIRERWLEHVSTEEKLFVPVPQEEWERYLCIVLEALTDDCVMEVRSRRRRRGGLDRVGHLLPPGIPIGISSAARSSTRSGVSIDRPPITRRAALLTRALCRTRTDDPFLTMEVLYQLS